MGDYILFPHLFANDSLRTLVIGIKVVYSKYMKNNRRGFTLLELLISIALLAILVLLMSGNFSTTLKRGRDTKRKADLNQLQKVLETYYEETHAYPVAADVADGTLSIFDKKICSKDLTSPGNPTIVALTIPCPFTTLMIKTPTDPSSIYTYKYVPAADGSSYYLYSYLENDQDTGNTISKTGFNTSTLCSNTGDGTIYCRYYVSSPNATALTAQ